MSVLTKFTKKDVITDPYPCIIAEDVLDPALYAQLIAEFPPLEIITKGKPYKSNERLNYSAHEVAPDNRISPVWRNFIEEHSSASFLHEFVNLFEDHIRAFYPNFEQEVAPLTKLRPGVRDKDDFTQADILLEAQIAVNTPVLEPSSVRGPHLDLPDKIYAGLFYLRPPGDDSTGGELQIYRTKRGKKLRLWNTHTADDYVDVVRTVPYRSNVLVFFLNTEKSLHGVTVRSKTNHTRCFLNLVAEVKKPLFDLSKFDGSLMEKVMGRLKRLVLPGAKAH